MHNPTAAILIIGDEILSGRTQDANVQFLATRLGELGIDLKEVRIISDDESAIVDNLRSLSEKYTQVLTTGGLGATHDDITAGSVAKAFGRELYTDPVAFELLKNHYKERFNEVRQRMAIIPVGASMIDNPVSVAPGFQVENVFCLAGIPLVMQAMFEGLLDRLKTGRPYFSRSVLSKVFENNIATQLAEIQVQFPEVSIGSYPQFNIQGSMGLTIVIRGLDSEKVDEAVGAVDRLIREAEGK